MATKLRTRRGAPALAWLNWIAVLPLLSLACAKQAEPDDHPKESVLSLSPENFVIATSRRLESGLTFSGQLEPAEVVEVKARFDGDLESVKVREGEAVRRGQSLASFRRATVEGEWKAAAADELAAQAALVAAQNGARRAHKLFEAGAASASDVESADAQEKAAKARLEAAASHRTLAGENADDLDVPSPINGRVSEVAVHGGDRVAVGDPILTVVDTRELELSATVPSESLEKVAPGTAITFHLDAFPGESFEGRVSRVNPTTEPGTRQLRIYTRIVNSDSRLVGGLFATGQVVEAAKDGALGAPVACLRQEGTETVVYAVRGGRAERVPVTVGLRDQTANLIELQGAISAGDSLLVGVLPGIRDGVRVRRNGS